MTNGGTIRVLPWTQPEPRACLICAVGFERRSRYFAETSPIEMYSRRIAVPFPDRHELAFDDNYKWFRAASFEIMDEIQDDKFEGWVETCLSTLSPDTSNRLTLCIDVSSLSRFRMAAIVAAIGASARERTVIVDFVYCPAEYCAPSKDVVTNKVIGPVMPQFAGWSVEPDLPTSAVVGLGYEYDRAVGAVEYLDPSDVWVFRPTGHDERYTFEIDNANEGFLQSLPATRIVGYNIFQPFDCFVVLESLVSGLHVSERVVTLPFGPKMFAVCCLLLSATHRDVAVWRVSSESLEPPVDRVPIGRKLGLTCVFEKKV